MIAQAAAGRVCHPGPQGGFNVCPRGRAAIHSPIRKQVRGKQPTSPKSLSQFSQSLRLDTANLVNRHGPAFSERKPFCNLLNACADGFNYRWADYHFSLRQRLLSGLATPDTVPHTASTGPVGCTRPCTTSAPYPSGLPRAPPRMACRWPRKTRPARGSPTGTRRTAGRRPSSRPCPAPLWRTRFPAGWLAC